MRRQFSLKLIKDLIDYANEQFGVFHEYPKYVSVDYLFIEDKIKISNSYAKDGAFLIKIYSSTEGKTEYRKWFIDNRGEWAGKEMSQRDYDYFDGVL